MKPSPPAFPWTLINGVETVNYPGLDQRSYFAAKALEGLCAAHSSKQFLDSVTQVADNHGVNQGTILANMAVEYADCLIDALQSPMGES